MMKLVRMMLPASVKKKSLIAAIVLCTLAIGVPVALSGEPTLFGVKSDLQIWSNGKHVSSSNQPVVINNNVYLPLRTVGEALGKQIEWDEREQTIIITDLPAK
jgi:hypothetical protein